MSRDTEFSDTELAWRAMSQLVFDNRDTWRRRVATEVDMPFSRVRVLRRLLGGALTMSELATAAAMDAPATTVAVNELERRGYVERTVEPANRRSKRVTVTPEGRAVMDTVAGVSDPPHDALAALSGEDAAELRRILGSVVGVER